MSNRITLFLMSFKGLQVLEALGENFADSIDFVVTARNANIQDDCYIEIKAAAERLKINCYDRSDKYEVSSSYAIAVSWRWLISLTSTKLIVFHDSLLPKYRGFNPLVSYLINKEETIGVTALFAADKYDTGDIIGKCSSKIKYPIKIKTAIEIISNNYVSLAGQIVETISKNQDFVGEKQNDAEATYSLWRDESDYNIDWNKSSDYICRFIDAVGFPYSGATTLLDGKLVRILEAEIVDDIVIENRTAGKVIFLEAGLPVIVCGSGLLKISELVDNESGENLLPFNRFRVRFRQA